MPEFARLCLSNQDSDSVGTVAAEMVNGSEIRVVLAALAQIIWTFYLTFEGWGWGMFERATRHLTAVLSEYDNFHVDGSLKLRLVYG